MKRDWTAPELEYGHEPPPPRKKADRRRVARPSPWYAFLNSVPVGTASFRVEWPQLATVRNVAQRMGITLDYQDTKEKGPRGLRLARVWRRT